VSTIKVTNIQHASASTAAIALDSSGQATLNGLNFPTAGSLSNRNLIINGAMQVAQRGTLTGVALNTNTYLTCDRFQTSGEGTSAVVTTTQDSDAPNGFGSSLKIDVTTADASLAASDAVRLLTRLEGQDLQRIKKGTADAQQVTLSFSVKSPKTGTHIVELFDADTSGQRTVSASYNITSANTWQDVSVTLPADTTGEFDNDNNGSLLIIWWLAAGSNYTSGTLQTSWAARTDANRAVGQVNCLDDAANDFYLTGVQLEVGSVATPFEHRSFGDELRRCQRYCQTLGGAEYNQILLVAYKNAIRVEGAIKHVVQMRTGPSVTTTGSGNFTADKGGSTFATDLVFQSVITAETNQDVTYVDFSPGTSVSGSDGQCGFLYNNASSTRKLILSAEL
jgi:hypothetical protein